MRNARRVLLIVLALASLAVLGWAGMNRNLLRTVLSLRRVDDYPLFVMRLYGDGEVGDLLRPAQGATGPTADGGAPYACTCFSARGDGGGRLFGRNFDWYHRPVLVLLSDPADGYASMTISDAFYLLPDADRYVGAGAPSVSFADRVRLMNAVRIPFDGMNERGLVVGMMAVPDVTPPRDPAKATIDSLGMIRLLLNGAATVDEALALMDGLNMDFGSGPVVHYLIADSTGASAVVEYTAAGMLVLRPDDPYQVSTNFPFTGGAMPGGDTSCPRYNLVYAALEASGGVVTSDEAMGLLEQSAQDNTRWSAVYDQTTGELSIAVGRGYGQVHRFQLPAGE